MVERDIRREVTVDIDHKYQKQFEAADNMHCQLKQINHLNRDRDYTYISFVRKKLPSEASQPQKNDYLQSESEEILLLGGTRKRMSPLNFNP